jgi:SGNH domain (fused to AT3 domains)
MGHCEMAYPQQSRAEQNNFHLIRKLRGLLIFLFLASFGYCIYYTPIDSKLAFYLLPARVWEFASGGLLALYLVNFASSNEITPNKASRTWLGTSLATVGVVLCVLSITLIDGSTLHYQGLWAVWPVAGATALIAGLTVCRSGFWNHFFSFRPFVWIGLLSYSWYLWHWPLLTIYKIYSLGEDTLVLRILICLVALAAAYVSYRFVEQPIRKRKPWMFANAKGSLLAGGVMVLLMVSIAAALLVSKEFQQLDAKHKLLEAAKDDRTNPALCTSSDNTFSELTICNTNTKGVDTKAPFIVLWGDSHADHFTATLLAKYPEHNIHKMVFPGCPPLIDDGLIVYNYSSACQAFNKAAMAHIKSLGSQIDHLYISARWPGYFGQAPISIAENTSTYPRGVGMYESMKFGLTNVLAQLTQWSVKTTILGATPELILNSPKCLMKRPHSTCDISKKLSDAYLAPSYTALQDVVRARPYTKLLDMRPYFCNITTCFSSKDGQPLYTDDHHITATAARSLAVSWRFNITQK